MATYTQGSRISLANRIWTAVSFLAIAAQLGLVVGFTRGLLVMFFGPVIVAFAKSLEAKPSTSQVLANVFLSLIGLGLIISKFPAIMPSLGGFDKRIPPESDRVLTWYSAVYLVYFTGVMPVYALTAELANHKQGKMVQISRPTCYLGLVAVAVICPGIVLVAISHLGFLPLW
jgi:hypothetical protein